mgnify:CR=1 FL=1
MKYVLSVLLVVALAGFSYGQNGKGKGQEKKAGKTEKVQGAKAGKAEKGNKGAKGKKADKDTLKGQSDSLKTKDGKENRGNAYGRNKDSLSGKEFGQQRAADAKAAAAEKKESVEEKISENQKKLKEARKKLDEAEQRGDITKEKAEEKRKKLDDLEKQLEEAQEEPLGPAVVLRIGGVDPP